MNKDELFEQISQEEIFLKFLNLSRFPSQNISSPFSEDKNESFKLYENGSYKCHSTGKQGDCFQLVADLNKLDCKSEFQKVLQIICNEFSIDYNTNSNKFSYHSKNLSDLHTNYYLQGYWNVTKNILEKYNVLGLDKFEYWNKKKNILQQIKLYTGVFGFVYPVNGNVELYVPKQEKASKFFYNNLKTPDIFGLNQLDNNLEFLIICAGKKDCLILNANGFPAVSFRSENHYITKEQIEILRGYANNIFICYDNDKAGQDAVNRAVTNFGISPIYLPPDFNDIADFFLKYPKEKFQEIFNESFSSQAVETKPNNNIFVRTEKWLSSKYKFRYNEIAIEIEYCKKGSYDWKSLNENSLYIELQKSGINCSINNLLAILRSDYVSKYNPLLEYFINLPKWDGVTDYIEKLCNYVNVYDRKQFNYHFKKWCVRTVKCVFQNDYFNKQALVLVHKGQSSGKSTFCRFMCPPTLSNYIAEDISNDKDARILLAKNFLINLDELAVLSRKEINQLKSYFSKTVINERLPYDRKNSILPRVCSFIGSTNMSNFLNDDTGSVRWLCFELSNAINFNYKKEIDINMVWSQALALSLSNFDSELTVDDIKENEERNSKFASLSVEHETIARYFTVAKPNGGVFMTSSDVMQYLYPINSKLNHIQIGKALNALGYEKVKDKTRQVYGYVIQPLPLFEEVKHGDNEVDFKEKANERFWLARQQNMNLQ